MPEEELTEEEIAILMSNSDNTTGGLPSSDLLSPPQTVFGKSPTLISFFGRLVGEGLCVIFGDTGSGKTKLVSTLTMEAMTQGKTVTYFDLEGNIHPHVLKKMTDKGCKHQRVKHMSDIYKNLSRVNTNILICDSATLQITGRWKTLPQHERGALLQELQYLYQQSCDWCLDHHGMVLMIAQPISEFGGKALASVGDKASFFAKTELYVDYIKEGLTVKKRDLVVFKDRVLPVGMRVCALKTTVTGVEYGSVNPEALKILELLEGGK